MAGTTSKCGKCGGRMEEGFLLDLGHGNRRNVEQWVEGEPTPSFWMGISLGNRKARPVTTLRCTSCGYLESYAD